MTGNMKSDSILPSSSEEHRRLQLVLEATSDGVFDWHIPSGECYFSPRLYTMLGYENGEFPAHVESWRERVFPEDLVKAEALIQSHFADESVPYKIEFRMLQKDGSWKWILSRGKVVERDSEGRPVRMLGTHIDISERKSAESKYSRLIENLSTGFALHDVVQDDSGKVVDYRYLQVNPAFERITGRRAEDVLGKSFRELVPEADPAIIELFGNVALTGIPTQQETHIPILGAWYETWVYPVSKGQFAILFNDITERKRQEKAIQQSEKRYRKLFENLTTGFALHEVVLDDSGRVVDYRFLEANPAYERLTGLQADRILGKTVLEVLPGIESYWIENFGRVALTGEPLRFENFAAPIRKWYETWAYQSEPLRFAVLVSDITERKNQEEAIRLSETRFREVADMSLDMLSRHDLAGICLWASPACRQILGVEPDAVVGRDAFEFIVEQDRDSVRSSLARLLDEGKSSLQYRILRADGSTLWAETLWSLTRNTDGSPFEIHCSTRDIGERRIHEEALQRSEEQFRFLAENSLDVVLRLDAEGRYLWVSPSMKTILGEDPDALVGTLASTKVHPDDLDHVIQSFRQLAQGSKMAPVVLRHVKDNGEIVWVESIGKGVFEPGTDRIKEILISTRDITERRESQRRIEELAAFNQQLIDTTGGIIVVFDRQGLIQRFNHAAEELFGWKEEEVLGRPFFDIFLPESRKQLVANRFPDDFDSFEPRRFENDWLARDGSSRWIAWANSPIRGEDGTYKYVVCTGLDRTLQRKTEQQLVELNSCLEAKVQERTAELQIAVKELESFSYSISHDLRSPLRAIDGFSLALIEDAGPNLAPELRNYLDRIRSASTHMAHLIDDLLELSRSSRVEIRKSEVDLGAIAHEILEGLHGQSPERSLFAKVDPGIRVQGDPILVRSILDNLLGNSWKYSSTREEAVIEVTSEIVDGRRWVQIRDNGIGFDMDHAGKLFGTFQRLHQGSQFEGTGIGLATVKKLVERHGGSITGTGIPDKGAVFKFTLDPPPERSR